MVFHFSHRRNVSETAVSLPVPTNDVIAAALSRAELEDDEAYYELGVAFSTGAHEAAADPVEALKWFHLAAARGHCEAEMMEVKLASDLTAREIHEAQCRARLWQVVNRSLAA